MNGVACAGCGSLRLTFAHRDASFPCHNCFVTGRAEVAEALREIPIGDNAGAIFD
jgi:hypothetical protein